MDSQETLGFSSIKSENPNGFDPGAVLSDPAYASELKSALSSDSGGSVSERVAAFLQSKDIAGEASGLTSKQYAKALFYKAGTDIRNKARAYWSYAKANGISGFENADFNALSTEDLGYLKLAVESDMITRAENVTYDIEIEFLLSEANRLGNKSLINRVASFDKDAGRDAALIDDISGIEKTDPKWRAAFNKRRIQILKRNRIVGREYEKMRFAELLEIADNVYQQVVISVNVKGKKHLLRLDAIAFSKNGVLIIEEYKSSQSAPLTENQRKYFETIKNDGATVVSSGKGIFHKDYVIQPGTVVDVLRPGDVRKER